ncbi:helix-turn-helix domain-containing protein [Vibrio phage ST2-1pr]|jgi:phage terminase Nu1 subunit (DNA packaging protein)|uniref:helix-turn-helix domain-containing protein n=1 Tax=Vibrio sp. St2 TaxID=2853441 RepID=UPI001C75DBE5|nr:helix-turn-helix domain-containing protein [Vibrio sp. St2]QXM18757.1 helix-turn-helix domain-containing protein [Vibrio phage ST2-1pr]
MSNLFNTDKKFTQSDIAKLLGISERQVRNLIQQGILPAAKGRDGMNPLACNHAYITYKSRDKTQSSEPEVGEDGEELSEEKQLEREELRLKIEDKRESVAMKKAKRVLFEKSYAPIELIVETLVQLSSRVNSRLDGLLPKLKTVWPDMPPEAVEKLEEEIIKASNECADVRPDLSDYFDGDPESMPAWIAGLEEGSSSDWNRVGE